MRNRILVSIIGLSLLGGIVAAAPLGTAFTYQGKLEDAGNPVNGSYDLKFTLFATNTTGAPIAGPLTNAATEVENGYFVVMLDFGTMFDGNSRWLEIGVRTNGGGDFTTLSPRQALTPTPYALYTPSAGAAATATTAASASSIAATNVTGTLTLSQLPGAVVTNNASGVTLGGTFTGNGSGLASVNADLVDGQHGAFYQNATNLTSGTLADVRLSANVALLNTNQVFSGSNRFSGVAVMTNAANSLAGTFAGNASGLTNLNASQLASGTVPDGRLSSNVAFLNGNQSFTGSNRFAGVVTLTNVANTIVGAFNGNATGLTNLNASQLTSGTVALALLPGAVVTNNETGLNLSGTFSGNGAGVTNVNLVAVNSQGAISWMTNWGNFILTSSAAMGNQPTSIAAADVNGDNKVDLICSGYFTGYKLAVFINDGAGHFVLASSPVMTDYAGCVTTADVNGDGKMDLIAANHQISLLTVLTNNGSGAFISATTLPVGGTPYWVTAADVNGDGKVDLISADYGTYTLTVLTNNGSGGFVISSSPGVGAGPRCVTASDLNGDGKPDLISANIIASTLTVLTNNGSGGFVASSSPGVGAQPHYVTAADVNGDGKVDLISANQGNNTLSVLTNNGSGGFVSASSPAVGSLPFSVAAADVNNDGKLDLISANSGANTLTVLTNKGSGGFAVASSPVAGSGPSHAMAEDVNGDGKVDLISVNQNDNTMSVLFNTPASYCPTFTGNAGGLTNLNASQLAGTVSLAVLPSAVVTNNQTGLTLAGAFSGNAAGLTNLSATNLVGTITEARLSTNVTLLNANQTFTGSNRFAGVVTLTNAANTLSGTFTGNGAGLTNLNASQLASGSVSLALLPSVLVTNNQSGVSLSGTFSGNAAGLTNLNASQLASGTVPDARLSANVTVLGQSIESGEITDGTIAATDVNVTNFNTTFWRTAGNAGTTGGTHFVGTTDNQPLEFKVNNQRVLRLDSNLNVIGGYGGNSVTGGYSGSTIGGGGTTDNNNTIAAPYATIAGGAGNTIGDSANYSAIGGGIQNVIASIALEATIAGGYTNYIGTNANFSAIGGGFVNKIGAQASSSTIGGGSDNRIATGADSGTIPGGRLNAATSYAFAAGNQAKANHAGAFVWGDSTLADIASTNANSVTMRASGGYRLFSNSGATAGAYLAAGGGSWTSMSDRNSKENFEPVDTSALLEKVAGLPMSTWNYKRQDANVRHIGPMAQDFKAAFGVGETDTGITSVDVDGVALAAIQGLNQKLETQRTENAELKKQLEQLKAIVATLSAKINGGAK